MKQEEGVKPCGKYVGGVLLGSLQQRMLRAGRERA